MGTKNFYSLTNLILKETSFNIVFGGNKKEIKILKALNLPDSDRIFVALGLPVINYAYLLSRASLLVSNNTGPMHIGYAVNTPTIGIFQSVRNGHPDLVGPYKLDKTFFPTCELFFLGGGGGGHKRGRGLEKISNHLAGDRALILFLKLCPLVFPAAQFLVKEVPR